MKQLILYIIFLFCIACLNKKEHKDFNLSKNQAGKFVINGNIQNSNSVVLYELNLKQMNPIDTAFVKEDNFTISTPFKGPKFYRLKFSNGNSIRIFIDTMSTINITCNAEELNTYNLVGSSKSIELMKLDKLVLQGFLKLDSLNNYLRNNKDIDINSIQLRTIYTNESNQIGNWLKNELILFINNHLTSPVSIMALFQPFGNAPLFNPADDIDFFKKISNNIGEKYNQLGFVSYLKNEIKRIDIGKVGSNAPDFTLNSPTNQSISLSDYRGKFVLLDFWASWCAPCRKENPNLVRLYKEYHPKGLEIIGISLDGTPRQKNAKQNWIDAINQDELIWPQVSQLKGWQSSVTKTYGFNSIPYTILIDKDGLILATNLRGKKLEDKLKAVLN